MKKTLIALAVLAASGAVLAQSSVTLYGKANIGLNKTSGASLAAASGADGSASRFGFKGTEDLGGGLKAGFLFEAGVNLGDGSTDAKTFQRQAYASLGGGFGEIRVGRQYSVGFMRSIGYMPSTSVNAQLRAGLGFNGVGSRNDANVRYISPNFGGITVELGTQLKGNVATALTEASVAYANGPLALSAYTSHALTLPGSNTAINGSYNFGTFNLAAGYIDLAGSGTGKGAFIHAGANMGAFTPYFQFARNSDNKHNVTELGARYALSKRTAFYTHTSNDSKAAAKSIFVVGFDHNF